MHPVRVIATFCDAKSQSRVEGERWVAAVDVQLDGPVRCTGFCLKRLDDFRSDSPAVEFREELDLAQENFVVRINHLQQAGVLLIEDEYAG